MFALLLAAAAADPFPPTRVNLPPETDQLVVVAAAVEKQTGLKLVVPASEVGARLQIPKSPQTLWGLVESSAAGRRIVVEEGGGRVRFDVGPPAPAAVDGAFRVAVRGVTCRHDYDAGPPVCEVALDLHWEPRLAVVRVADASGGKAAVTTARHATTARLTDVPRSAAKLPTLEVGFTVTAAERMLTFIVPELAAPKPQTVESVALTPRPPRKLDVATEFRLELLYPEGHPEFESFESWTADNRCRLVHHDGRTLETNDYNETSSGRRVTLDYRFPTAEVGDLAGWSLEYRTPGPLREFPVRFSLKDIPLP